MMDATMVERVARALADGGHLGVSLAFRPVLDTDKGSIPALKMRDTERALAAARAAIEAMREPTPEMVRSAVSAFSGYNHDFEAIEGRMESVLEAAIDAALTPQTSP